MRRAAILLTVSASVVLLATWSVLRSNAATETEPLWAPLPGVASAPSRDPLDSKEICTHTANLKARFAPSSVRTAVLGYVIEPDGSVDTITIAGTSGSRVLDQAIMACVATLRFTPLRRGRAMMVQWK